METEEENGVVGVRQRERLRDEGSGMGGMNYVVWHARSMLELTHNKHGHFVTTRPFPT